MLVRVEAPHYVAGIVVENGAVTFAAPILAWSIGKSADFMREYFRDKGYRASIVKEHSVSPQ